jgi:hypothetical protein
MAGNFVSKSSFSDAYLFLDHVIYANSLEDHVVERVMLFDKGYDSLLQSAGATVVPAGNLLAVDGSRPGEFYGDRSGRGWLFCDDG